jgi:hypothetical protein
MILIEMISTPYLRQTRLGTMAPFQEACTENADIFGEYIAENFKHIVAIHEQLIIFPAGRSLLDLRKVPFARGWPHRQVISLACSMEVFSPLLSKSGRPACDGICDDTTGSPSTASTTTPAEPPCCTAAATEVLPV